MKNKLEYFAHYRKADNEIQFLWQHLSKTASLNRNRCEKINLPLLGELLGLLHDIGKYSLLFQHYFLSGIGKIEIGHEHYIDPIANRGKIDHSTAGGQYLWKNSNETPIRQLICQIASLCLISHHGGLIDFLAPDGNDKFSLRINKDHHKTFFDEVAQAVEPKIENRIQEILNSNDLEPELTQWLNRSSINLPSRKAGDFTIGFLTKLIFSTLIDSDRTDTATFENPDRVQFSGNYPKWDELTAVFETYINRFKQTKDIDRLRSDISDACRKVANVEQGAYLLTLPTGSGKTLASLRFALHHAMEHGLDRIIYVIPYTSIIDQNAGVTRKIFKASTDRQIVLEHHSNLVPRKDTEENQILSENWDTPIVFTTTVQFLNTFFAGGTKSVRRLHQLVNSVVIFDEIQTLPVNTVHLFNNAMNFMTRNAKTTALYCTATQPLLNEVDKTKGALELSNLNSIVTLSNEQQQAFKRTDVLNLCKAGGWSNNEIAEAAINSMRQYESVLVIVNTKTVAKNVFELCKQIEPECKMFHLSTSMCPAHRKVKFRQINHLLNSRQPVICVSTQLIEAGVDIDFGCVMRSLAGLDSIAQATGRCNRHGERVSSKVIVLNANQEYLGKLRDIKAGQNATLRVLNDLSNPQEIVINEEAMNLYYTYYFFDRKDEMSYNLDVSKLGRNDNLLNLLTDNPLSVNEYIRNNKTNTYPLLIKQSFKTAGDQFEAIDAPTKGIIIRYGRRGKQIVDGLCESQDTYESAYWLRRAQRFSVNLFPHVFNKLREENAIIPTQPDSDIFYLDEQYYSDEFGVNTEPVNDMTFLNA